MAATKKATAEVAETIVDATAEEKVEKKPAAKTTKKTTKAVKAETEAVETAAEKTTAKKTAAKKTTTTKKTTTRKTTKKAAEPTVDFYVEFNGVQEAYASVIENVKRTYLESNEGAEIKNIKIYLKPTENAAYCVINDEAEFKMDVYFC